MSTEETNTLIPNSEQDLSISGTSLNTNQNGKTELNGHDPKPDQLVNGDDKVTNGEIQDEKPGVDSALSDLNNVNTNEDNAAMSQNTIDTEPPVTNGHTNGVDSSHTEEPRGEDAVKCEGGDTVDGVETTGDAGKDEKAVNENVVSDTADTETKDTPGTDTTSDNNALTNGDSATDNANIDRPASATAPATDSTPDNNVVTNGDSATDNAKTDRPASATSNHVTDDAKKQSDTDPTEQTTESDRKSDTQEPISETPNATDTDKDGESGLVSESEVTEKSESKEEAVTEQQQIVQDADVKPTDETATVPTESDTKLETDTKSDINEIPVESQVKGDGDAEQTNSFLDGLAVYKKKHGNSDEDLSANKVEEAESEEPETAEKDLSKTEDKSEKDEKTPEHAETEKIIDNNSDETSTEAKTSNDKEEGDVSKTDDSVGKEVDDNLTKVVISEEGVPQVSVTEVPDRPPSSTAGSIKGDGDTTETTEPVPDSDSAKRESNASDSSEIPEEIGNKKEVDRESVIGDAKAETVDEDITQEATDSDLEKGNRKESKDTIEEDIPEGNEQVDEDKDKHEAMGVTENETDVVVDNNEGAEDKVEMGKDDTPQQDTAETGSIDKADENKDDTSEPKQASDSAEKVPEQTKEPVAGETTVVSNDTQGKDEPTTESGHIVGDETQRGESVKIDDDAAGKIDASASDTKADDTIAGKQDSDKSEEEKIESGAEKSEEETNKDTEESASKVEEKVKPPTPEPEPEPVKQMSPLDLLLEKNVTIEGNVDILVETEQKIITLLDSMKHVMVHYSEILKLQPMKDFTMELGRFRGDMKSVNDACVRWGEMSTNINKYLKELRDATEGVKAQINRKYQQEDLSTWIDTPPEVEKEKALLQEQVYANEKAAQARIADARHAVATAATGMAEAQQQVVEMEKQMVEAEVLSEKSAAQAKAAIVAAEEARLAAEEKRKAEEASKKRSEERARQKAAEEQKRKAEEEMRIYQEAARKGTNPDDERNAFMEEKAKREIERKNPKNWPKYEYSCVSADFNPPTGCIIRAIDGSMKKSDIKCVGQQQNRDSLVLADQEELISNIIDLKQSDVDRKFTFEEAISICIPVSISRTPTGKESVVRQLRANGTWRDLPTADVQFDEYRETKFVDGRSKGFGTFVVILRPKRDELQISKKGNKVACSFDSRLSITARPATFISPTNFILESNAVDPNAIHDLKMRSPQCDDLLTSSAFISFRLLTTYKPEKPLTFTVPLPHQQKMQKRPTTAAVSRDNKIPDVRPSTARVTGAKEEEPADEIHFLFKDDKTGWTVNKKITLVQPKNKEIVTFDSAILYNRFLLLRTKIGKRDAALEKMASLLEQITTERSAKIILRQRHDDVSEVRVACCLAQKAEKIQKTLEDDGFTEGPSPSANIILKEGQHLYLKFRGNVDCISKDPNLTFLFNSNIKCFRDFKVDEKDTFAQKGLTCFRGFVQVFTKALVPKPIPDGAPKNVAPDMVEAEMLLAELLIELPKPDILPPKPLSTAPLSFREGPLTNGVLRLLAGQLGKEWKDLALQLNLRPMRIQAILRQHVNKDTPDTRYDMLMTWAKRVPRSVDKVQILCNALTACGRLDLADEMRQKGTTYKQQRFMNARVSHLKQAFVKVAKARTVFNKWKAFAKELGVPDEDIERIETAGGSGQEMCFSSLETWKDSAGDNATISTLAKHLRDANQERLSRDVESILSA